MKRIIIILFSCAFMLITCSDSTTDTIPHTPQETITVDSALMPLVNNFLKICVLYGYPVEDIFHLVDTVRLSGNINDFPSNTLVGMWTEETKTILIFEDSCYITPMAYRLILFHEFGHAMGKGHVCYELRIMNPRHNPYELATYYRNWDDLVWKFFTATNPACKHRIFLPELPPSPDSSGF